MSWCGHVLLVWWAKWTCMYVACCIVFFRFLLQVIGKCAETLSREKVAVGASACDTQFLLQQVTHLMLYITHMFQSGEKGLAHGNKSHASWSTSPTCSSHGNKSHASWSTSPTCSSHGNKSHASWSTSPTCSSHGNKSHASWSTSPTCSSHGNKSHASCLTSPTCSSHGNKSHTSCSTSPTFSSQVRKG